MAIIRIKDRHREIMRRLLCGHRQVDIAQDLQIGEAQLSIIINSPLFRQAMNHLQDNMDKETFDVVEEMRTHSEKAVNIILGVMKDPLATNPEKLSSAKTVLQLAGHGQSAGHSTTNTTINYNSLTFEQKLELADQTRPSVEGRCEAVN